MSALPLHSPRPRREESPRRHLAPAPAPAPRRARPRLLHAVVTIGGIGVILLAQLLLSIALADGAYTIAGLQGEARDLARQEQALTEQLEVLSSTQNLTANAENLGMVASGNPVFLDLSTGKIRGKPTPAGGRLTGSGNQVSNVLLGDTPLVERPAAEEPATPTTPVTPVTGSPATPGGASGGGSAPGTIPSPTTR